jgi:hypothetical protein
MTLCRLTGSIFYIYNKWNEIWNKALIVSNSICMYIYIYKQEYCCKASIVLSCSNSTKENIVLEAPQPTADRFLHVLIKLSIFWLAACLLKHTKNIGLNRIITSHQHEFASKYLIEQKQRISWRWILWCS